MAECPGQGECRVHAIVLTQERGEELRRCVETSLSTLGDDDRLTVLDDSRAEYRRENRSVLEELALGSGARVSHVPAGYAHDEVARAVGGSRMAWQARTAPRDISPHRNLSLLLAAASGAHTTVLIDDDVCDFDLAATHEFVSEESNDARGLIVGAHIGGWTEMDTITRLEVAMRRVAATPHDEVMSERALFVAGGEDCTEHLRECRWVSAGYMAFRIRREDLLAFPPGYNEDWLWCMLQRGDMGTRIVKGNQSVSHEPDWPRRPTSDDVWFELAGDLVLDALVECENMVPRNGSSTLGRLRGYVPDASILPLTRVREAMQEARKVERKGCMDCRLWEYGLAALQEIMAECAPMVDCKQAIATWCQDAETKQVSFAPMPGERAVREALGLLTDQGRV